MGRKRGKDTAKQKLTIKEKDEAAFATPMYIIPEQWATTDSALKKLDISSVRVISCY